MSDQLFAVTGGPGSGKTTLLEALAQRGVTCRPEAGRAIIRDQSLIGGHALPWGDRSLFAEMMLAWDLRSYHEASAMPGPVMMDRGIPDSLGYLRLCDLPVPTHMEQAAQRFRYNRRVFVAPFWDEIFEQDEERTQDRDEARATLCAMEDVYRALGYELIPLPFVSVAQRVSFVLSHLSNAE